MREIKSEIVRCEEACNDEVQDLDDPVSKKLRRQLRNKDAAVRSRERKKTYVKDLEMKSRYYEGESIRLWRLLQCFIAENQALRLSLQKGSAFDVSSAKQEAVRESDLMKTLYYSQFEKLFRVCGAVKEMEIQDCWGLDNGIFSAASICRRVRFLSLEGCSLITAEGLEAVILSWKGLEAARREKISERMRIL